MVIKGTYLVGRILGKGVAHAVATHPQWLVYKAGILATKTVVVGVKVAMGIASGLLIGHMMGE